MQKESWFLESGSGISGDAGEMVSASSFDAGIGGDGRPRLHKFWRDSAWRFKGLLGLNMSICSSAVIFHQERHIQPLVLWIVPSSKPYGLSHLFLFSVMILMEELRNTWKSNSICRLISQKPTGEWRSSSAIGWRTTPCTRGLPSRVFVLSLFFAVCRSNFVQT